MRSSALIFLSLATMTFLSGCASDMQKALSLTLKPVIECPPLDPPPESAIDALEADAKVHPETGEWAVALEKHLTKLDACKPVGA